MNFKVFNGWVNSKNISIEIKLELLGAFGIQHSKEFFYDKSEFQINFATRNGKWIGASPNAIASVQSWALRIRRFTLHHFVGTCCGW